MNAKACALDECTKPAPNGRLCSMHKARKRRHGTTDAGPHTHGTPHERFERFVVRNPEGCWSWAGSTNDSGYPQISGGYAHRISWEIHNGPIPAGLSVLHHCDNPPCTNPDHLFVGTHANNMADAARKGRLSNRPNRPRGEAVKSSKLTVAQVQQIRQLCASGLSQRRAADRFGVSQRAVFAILKGQSWRSA